MLYQINDALKCKCTVPAADIKLVQLKGFITSNMKKKRDNNLTNKKIIRLT